MINAPKGTKDLLPIDSYKWQYVEKTARETAKAFGISEIRTPTFEHTEVFLRGVGEGTDIVNKEIIPAIIRYSRQISEAALAKRAFLPDVELPCEEKLVKQLSLLLSGISEKTEALQESVQALDAAWPPLDQARYCRDSIFQSMQALRSLVDEAEMIVEESVWPFPGYGALLTTK